MNKIMPRRALLSVSDKTDLIPFARALKERGVSIISTGGTARALRDSGIEVEDVSSVTGFPEIMAGRVKTLHPKVHGGILARRDVDSDAMSEHGIEGIDIVAINLYPFESVTADPDCDFATAVENIDIGGPAMVRASAKNHPWVTIVVDPGDYDSVIAALDEGGTTMEQRIALARKAFQRTAAYDATISAYLDGQIGDNAPAENLTFTYSGAQMLRYGENPHQKAAFYVAPGADPGSLAKAQLVQGKALSYNNLADADAALSCVRAFDESPACVIVKHANPCGVALASSALAAYEAAYATDPVSAFGGIIAFNGPLDAETARTILDRQFVEVMIATELGEGVVEVIAAKPNIRVLVTGAQVGTGEYWDFKRIDGGLLLQSLDDGMVADEELQVVTRLAPTANQLADLQFAWRVAKYVKSNAIVYARDKQTIGVGAGQMSRVVSAEIAGMKATDAGLVVPGSVMASDAFFPFRDGIDAAAKAGIAAVIQPGGSMRDEEVIAAADEHNIAMVFTGMRHFRH